SLDAVLQKLVETAAQLTGAQYAALGVLDASGARLERFVTSGIDEETHAAIGDLPRGEGILGVLIRDPQLRRLHDLRDDPRSAGAGRRRTPRRTIRRCTHSSAYPCASAGSSTATSISRRRRAARTSTPTTRRRSSSSPRRRRSRSRTRASTRRRRGGPSN